MAEQDGTTREYTRGEMREATLNNYNAGYNAGWNAAIDAIRATGSACICRDPTLPVPDGEVPATLAARDSRLLRDLEGRAKLKMTREEIDAQRASWVRGMEGENRD